MQNSAEAHDIRRDRALLEELAACGIKVHEVDNHYDDACVMPAPGIKAREGGDRVD